MNTPKLSDEQIEEIQGKAYRDLVAEGYTGGMGSLQWDRASARAIEAAAQAPLLARIAELEQDVHNLNWALGTDGYPTMATPEQQAEADKAHAETMARIEGMKKRRDRVEELESALKLTLDALTYQGTMGPTRRQRRHAAITAAIDAMRKGEQPPTQRTEGGER